MIKKVIPIFVFVILIGFTAGCITETEKEGYVDLWVFSVEPLDDGYIVAAGKYITTFEDLLTPYLD